MQHKRVTNNENVMANKPLDTALSPLPSSILSRTISFTSKKTEIMKQTKLWLLAAILTICGMTMVSCFSDTKKSTAVNATDDKSQFVTITDVVPDVILEIRYFGTYLSTPSGGILR